jgi:putative Flp pilus-assembly TadE/G-like protein
MTRIRCERGQATVLTAVVMIAMLGMAGFVVDVGSWFRQQRATQATVDAAALAGAQALPASPGTASGLASSFAGKNGGVAGTQITISSHFTANDKITVTQTKPTTGFFSKLFGITTVTVGSKASAISEVPTEVMGVAPIGVDLKHPKLSGPGCPCFNQPTTIDLGKVGVPGGFMIIDLDTDSNGTTGASTVADWIAHGYQAYLPLGDYPSDTGAKWNNSQIQNAITGRYGTDLLFPVYDKVTGGGSNAQYQIVGWASFHVTSTTAGGSSGQISGYFDRVIWDGVISTKGPKKPIPDLGVHSVALID